MREGGTNATNGRTDKTFRSLDNNRQSPIGIRTSSTCVRRLLLKCHGSREKSVKVGQMLDRCHNLHRGIHVDIKSGKEISFYPYIKAKPAGLLQLCSQG